MPGVSACLNANRQWRLAMLRPSPRTVHSQLEVPPTLQPAERATPARRASPTRRNAHRSPAARPAQRRTRLLGALATVLAGLAASRPPAALAFNRPFIGTSSTVTPIGSTVPANGDVNPYGIVNVPRTSGRSSRGDVLISNFNNSENQQGTGTTIVQITPARPPVAVRADRSRDAARTLPGRRGPDDRAGDPPQRLRRRRQPPDERTANPRRPRPAA